MSSLREKKKQPHFLELGKTDCKGESKPMVRIIRVLYKEWPIQNMVPGKQVIIKTK